MSTQAAQPSEIGVIARMTSGAVAIASLGAGGAAAFETDNEIGTAALLLVGVFAGIVAMLGRIPRIRFGDNELDPNVIAQATEFGADAVASAVVAAAEVDTAEPADLVEAANTARTELRGSRIALNRHYWGSQLGQFMIQRDPADNYSVVLFEDDGTVRTSIPLKPVDDPDNV